MIARCFPPFGSNPGVSSEALPRVDALRFFAIVMVLGWGVLVLVVVMLEVWKFFSYLMSRDLISDT